VNDFAPPSSVQIVLCTHLLHYCVQHMKEMFCICNNELCIVYCVLFVMVKLFMPVSGNILCSINTCCMYSHNVAIKFCALRNGGLATSLDAH